MMKKTFFGKMVVFALIAVLPLVSTVQANIAEQSYRLGNVFTDVSEENGYYGPLEYLKDEGIISGYPDGSYRPFQTINRAEFTKIIVGATGYNPAQDPSGYDIYALIGVPFSDVENGAWYLPYLREAKAAAIIDGYPDGSFKPAQEINFAEAAKIVVNGLGYQINGPDAVEWYRPYVEVLTTKKAIPHTIHSFDQKISRGEMAEMIYRLMSGNTYGEYQTYARLAAPKGYLEGSLSYPSEFIPEEMLVCAMDVSTYVQNCTYQKIKANNFLYGLGYRLPVPAGSYEVMAFVGSSFGGYSEFVTCGMDAENCTSHELVSVPVKVGQTVRDIDVMDWYLTSHEGEEWGDGNFEYEYTPMENAAPLDPSEWWQLGDAMGQLSSNEVIEWGVLIDAMGEMEYFATSNYAADLSSVTLRIYGCSTKFSCKPQRLWQQQYEAGAFTELDAMGDYLPMVSMVGWMPEGEGAAGSLILVFRDIDSADDFCTDPVMIGMDGGNGRGFAVFDLTSKTMTFGQYEPSQMVYDYAEVRQLQCEDHSGGAVG